MPVRFSPSTSPGGNALGALAGRAIGAGLIEHKRQADEMKKAALLLEIQTKRLEQDRAEFEQKKAQSALDFGLDRAKLLETRRSNDVTEARLGATADETMRHNRAAEENSIARTKAMGSASAEKVKTATDELADAKNHAHGVLSQMAQADPNMGKDADAIFSSVMEQKTGKGVRDKLEAMLKVYGEQVEDKHRGPTAQRWMQNAEQAVANKSMDEKTAGAVKELAQSVLDKSMPLKDAQKAYQGLIGAKAQGLTEAQTQEMAASEIEQLAGSNPDPDARKRALHVANLVKLGELTADQGMRQIEDQGLKDMAFKRAAQNYQTDKEAWGAALTEADKAALGGKPPVFEEYLQREEQRLGLGQQGPAPEQPAAPVDPIQEAAKMKAQGATKEQVRAFLAQHGIKLKD